MMSSPTVLSAVWAHSEVPSKVPLRPDYRFHEQTFRSPVRGPVKMNVLDFFHIIGENDGDRALSPSQTTHGGRARNAPSET